MAKGWFTSVQLKDLNKDWCYPGGYIHIEVPFKAEAVLYLADQQAHSWLHPSGLLKWFSQAAHWSGTVPSVLSLASAPATSNPRMSNSSYRGPKKKVITVPAEGQKFSHRNTLAHERRKNEHISFIQDMRAQLEKGLPGTTFGPQTLYMSHNTPGQSNASLAHSLLLCLHLFQFRSQRSRGGTSSDKWGGAVFDVAPQVSGAHALVQYWWASKYKLEKPNYVSGEMNIKDGLTSLHNIPRGRQLGHFRNPGLLSML